MASLGWGGFRNGCIPQAALKPAMNFIPLFGEPVGVSGGYLMAEAADQWAAMSEACYQATGEYPTMSEGYRDLVGQRIRKEIQLRDGRPLAAAVGYSVHGWARSNDVGERQRSWLHANSEAYGWYFTVDSEEWHMDYLGNPSIRYVPIPKPEPIRYTKEHDMLIIRERGSGFTVALDTQFVRHLDKAEDIEALQLVLTDPRIKAVNNEQLKALYENFGVPQAYNNLKGLGVSGTWSIAEENRKRVNRSVVITERIAKALNINLEDLK